VTEAARSDVVAGVLGVWRLWRRTTACDAPQAVSGTECAADQAVIYGLGLGLRETLGVLFAQRPDFAAFERRVIDRGGFNPPEWDVHRLDWHISLAPRFQRNFLAS
jgi:hypothetical protein